MSYWRIGKGKRRQRLGEYAVDPVLHLGLVYDYVLRHCRVHGPVADTDEYQDGCVGLCIAARKFDPARGTAFSTYATWWIRMHVIRGRRVRRCQGPGQTREGWRPTVAFTDIRGGLCRRLRVPPATNGDSESASEAVEKLLGDVRGLTDRERRYLKLRADGRMYREIDPGISRERVRQILARAIRKVRKHCMSESRQ